MRTRKNDFSRNPCLFALILSGASWFGMSCVPVDEDRMETQGKAFGEDAPGSPSLPADVGTVDRMVSIAASDGGTVKRISSITASSGNKIQPLDRRTNQDAGIYPDASIPLDAGTYSDATIPSDASVWLPKLFSDEPIHLALDSQEAQIIRDFYSVAAVKRSRVVRINYQALKESSFYTNLFSDLGFEVDSWKIENRDDVKNASWFGKKDKPFIRVVITAAGGYVAGSIRVGVEYFILRPLGKRYGIILDLDETELVEPPCGTEEGSSHESGSSLDPPGKSNVEAIFGEEPERNINILSGGQPTRFLIAYANGAQNAIDPGTTMALEARRFINEMNDYLDVSGVSHWLQLARVYAANYSETCVKYSSSHPDCPKKFEDLCHFKLDDDNVMDEIHSMREAVQADICVLFREKACAAGAMGGEAWTIPALSSDEAFATVMYSWDSQHFAHEVGHLYGCRHYTDTTQGYMHGFHHLPGDPPQGCNLHYRTIIDPPCDAGPVVCKKELLFSNPYLEHPVDPDCPLGVLYVSECYRTINDNAPDIEDFYSPPADLSLLNGEEIKDGEYVYYFSTSTIKNWILWLPTDYDILDDGTAYFKADEIHLYPGFHAHAGSEVHLGKDVTPW